MIDKKSKKDVFKSIIYCSNLEQVFETEKKTKKGKKDSKVVDADFEDVTEKKDPKDDNKEKSA